MSDLSYWGTHSYYHMYKTWRWWIFLGITQMFTLKIFFFQFFLLQVCVPNICNFLMAGDATPGNSWTKWLLRTIKRHLWFLFSFLQFWAEDSLVAQESPKLQVQIKWDQRYLAWVLHGSNVLQNKLALGFGCVWVLFNF